MKCTDCNRNVYVPISKVTIEYIDGSVMKVEKGSSHYYCDQCFFELVLSSFRPSHMKLLNNDDFNGN